MKFNAEEELSLFEYRRFALMALWTGMIATVGIVFAFIPNIELVLLSAFLGGIALGPKRGFLVAALGEALFSALNPIGSGLGFPILYIFQIVSVGLCGLAGGLSLKFIHSSWKPIQTSVYMGVIALFLTLFFDLSTALSFPISSGMTEGALLGVLAAGSFFFILHMASNIILFALFGPSLIRLIDRQLLMNGLGQT
ncbi:MAG: hypothetical protein HQ508_01735 [Candidatus Marinimicrobia bacterium]|nr:hypothetical protein [Candidatus Neomarinimicrobiota bacterium]